ncbi:SDR family oxidoreductase [uncultured Tateyamaria sp.]|uniref:SDR family oxidoreductase n=1 Tax=uncultured Tateyamaria sp. TaxID=455651 RepID=UPI00261AEDFB|nr:SDR family oxidoreductase [uncultured Tateyamaria sp.]
MKIVITGVSKGLGRALSAEFANLGHEVAGCARNESAIEDLKTALGPQHSFTSVDLQSADEIEQWAKHLTSNWGVPNLLINNASMINGNAPLWQVSRTDFEVLMSTNVTAVFSTIQHFVPAMIDRRTGVVANISSGWGRSVSPNVGAYCTSKWAIEGMTLALAEDLPEGLAALSVDPGSIETEMSQSALGDAARNAQSPHEWAEKAAPFFLSLGGKHNGLQVSVPA